MARKKKDTPTPVQSEPTGKDIDPVLISSVQSLRALATTHNLLEKGLYHYSQAQNVSMCLNFVRSLHEQMASQALKHPQAAEIPELQSLIKGDK